MLECNLKIWWKNSKIAASFNIIEWTNKLIEVHSTPIKFMRFFSFNFKLMELNTHDAKWKQQKFPKMTPKEFWAKFFRTLSKKYVWWNTQRCAWRTSSIPSISVSVENSTEIREVTNLLRSTRKKNWPIISISMFINFVPCHDFIATLFCCECPVSVWISIVCCILLCSSQWVKINCQKVIIIVINFQFILNR